MFDGDIISVLPRHSTDLERALEQASLWVIKNSEIVDVWNPDTCPERFLPWLARSVSVDEWDASWSLARKREIIRSSVVIHRMKGTKGAVRRALEAAGFGGAVIIEGRWKTGHDGTFTYDGADDYGGPDHWAALQDHNRAFSYDGTEDYGEPDHWAEYRVRVPRPITISQSQMLRRILASVAPARCHLKRLYFTEVAHLFDRAISHNGTYTYGAA